LPAARGSYVLVLKVARGRRLAVGRLGVFALPAGYYLYVGSALGPGGLRARLARHLSVAGRPHWHVDRLRQCARPLEVWFAVAARKLEWAWVKRLAGREQFRAPIPRFGASDHPRCRTGHLFFSARRPTFRGFARSVRQIHGPGLALRCLRV